MWGTTKKYSGRGRPPKTPAQKQLSLARKAAEVERQNDYIRWLAENGFPGFVAEYKFHPNRMWRIDFYHPTLKIAIEVEGGVGRIGRHQRPDGFRRDIEKYNAMEEYGIRLHRVEPKEMKTQKLIQSLFTIKNLNHG